MARKVPISERRYGELNDQSLTELAELLRELRIRVLTLRQIGQTFDHGWVTTVDGATKVDYGIKELTQFIANAHNAMFRLSMQNDLKIGRHRMSSATLATSDID